MFLTLYVGAQTLFAGLRSKLRREDGAVATEYALLLVLIALAIIAAAIALGLAIANVFQSGADTLGGVEPNTG
ncbi:MAG TPA: Flp family type IVb pilin [Actinomycetota bacterium]|nr:Flp family type IVb pilin [Actinomycetota bacterium]